MLKTRWLSATVAVAVGMLLVSVPARTAVPTFIAADAKVTKITASQIRQVLNSMQAAAAKKDAEGVLKYLAPNIKIEVTVQSGARTQTLQLTREQYRQYLEQGFAATKNRRSRYSNLKVKVAPNGKSAVATYTLFEESTLVAQLVTIASVSDESVTFELVQGQILETLVKSTSRLSVKQP